MLGNNWLVLVSEVRIFRAKTIWIFLAILQLHSLKNCILMFTEEKVQYRLNVLQCYNQKAQQRRHLIDALLAFFLRVMFQLDFRLFFNLLWLISYPPHLLIPRTFIVFTSQNRYAFSEWTSWAAMDGCTNDWEGMSHAKYSWVVLQKLLILFRSFIKTIRIRLRCIVSELWCHFMSAIRHGKGRHAVDPKGRVRDKKKHGRRAPSMTERKSIYSKAILLYGSF